jgi:pimeloyl-ACP methyl ester carboxylesterase
MQIRSLLWVSLLAGLVPSLAHGQIAGWYPGARQGIIIVASGSGGDPSLTENLGQLVQLRGLPLAVVEIPWCRMSGPFKDHMDLEGQYLGARRVVEYVSAFRQQCPGEKVFLLGHSTGTHVLLNAVGFLPPRSVDQIVLLAPSISRDFDLRPALRCSKGGIISTCSDEDWILGSTATVYPTSDRKWTESAGAVGFNMPPPHHPDAALYRNLRLIPYERQMTSQRYYGGHFGVARAKYLDAYILPVLAAELRGY